MSIPKHVVFVEAWIRAENGNLLIAKRSSKDDQNGGSWSVPGGKVEEDVCDNIIEATLKKEVMEEVGIEIKNIKYFSSRSFIRSSGDHVVAMSFTADYLSGEAKPLDEQEEVQWIKPKYFQEYLHESFWANALNKLNV